MSGATASLRRLPGVERGEQALRARIERRERRTERKLERLDLPLGLDGSAVSNEQRHALASFACFLNTPLACELCGEVFRPRSVGTLACRFHPSAYINRGARLISSSDADPTVVAPSDCGTCEQLNMAAQLRDSAYTERVARRAGCTPIDHCSSLTALFSVPYFAVPTSMAHLLTAWRHASAAIGARSDTPVRAVLVRLVSQPNALLVRKAAQLERTLVIDVPHTRAQIRVPLCEIYDAMCARFALPPLSVMIRETRLANPIAALSNNGSYAHPDARKRAQLRVSERRKVLITPFVVLARLSQQTAGAVRMHLE